MGIQQKISFIRKYPRFLLDYIRLHRELARHRRQGRQRWVLQCDFKGHYPYLKPYYDFAQRYEDVEIYYAIGYSRKENPRKYLEQHGVPPHRILEPIDLVVRTDWDVYLSPTEWGNAFPRNRDALRVQLFHTLADKNLEYGKNLLNFNIIFANGPIHHQFMDKYVFKPYPHAKKTCRVIDTGFAKIDDLFDGTYSPESLRAELNIDAQDRRPIILFAPNWEATSALYNYGEKIFEIFARSNYIVLIKLHYMSFLSPEDHAATFNTYNQGALSVAWVDWKSVLEKYARYENIRIVQEQSINPLIYLADLMVTDYGGASLEFICMKKPIVYLDCPGFFKMRGEHIFENKSRETGPIIDDLDALTRCIDSALGPDDPYAVKRKNMAERLIYNPGRAAETGFTTLYRMVQQNRNENQGKE